MRSDDTASPPPLTGAGRVADLVRQLRDRISGHEILPGTPLREEALAQEFATSRASVREALSSLEERGLIERIPNIGARVTSLDFDMAVHIYETREALESQSVRLATLNSTSADWVDLHDRFAAARRDFEQDGGLEAYLAAIDAFRERTISLANNPVLLDFQEQMLDRTRKLIRRIAILPGRPEQGLSEHAALVTAIAAGDAEHAAQLARENIRSALKLMITYKDFLF